MSGGSPDLRKVNSELIRQIYSGVMNPAEYTRIFEAWDAHFALIEAESGEVIAEDFDWATEFVHHFEQAGRFFDHLHPALPQDSAALVDGLPMAACLVEASGRIQRANAPMAALFADGPLDNLFELPLDPASETALRGLLRQPGGPGQPQRCLFRVFPEDGEALHFCAEPLAPPDGPVRLVVKSVTGGWSPQLEAVLASAFGLTGAEVALLAALYQGQSIGDIAEARGRSPATLRTQLSAVLQKVGAKSQAQLSRIVAGLVHLVNSQPDPAMPLHAPPRPLAARRRQHSETLVLSNGLSVEIVTSGERDGQPVYFLQPTTLPHLTAPIVKALSDLGLRLISPMRPGTGGTTRTPQSFTARDWAALHLEVLDRLGIDALHLGGHCSGGVHALELAARAGARCRSVLLVDTGAPLRDLRMIHAMPPSPRRLFLAARYFPIAIETPIKLVAADFLSGPEGEARGVAYFYDGSPADEAILHDGDNWRITRDNMAHCFANVPQLVQDVRLWSQNTTRLMQSVAARSHVRFLHGGANLMMSAEAVRSFCAATPGTSCRIEPGAAQLMMYTRPAALAEEFRWCVDSCP